ncbi:hypothetical protein BpHYR1_053060 [Brachionus plicatilis]|uniref:Uncharacterized protein n=1 Tax=Brachionus plicatilis TaxID=10195 RepID=A0A3M7T073_BRAPC|nr:hypothetical protein BpHYR1_053060 [Brachionus plicatilis]
MSRRRSLSSIVCQLVLSSSEMIKFDPGMMYFCLIMKIAAGVATSSLKLFCVRKKKYCLDLDVHAYRVRAIEALVGTRVQIGEAPLGYSDRQNLMNADGRIVQFQKFRKRIFKEDYEASKRGNLFPILRKIGNRLKKVSDFFLDSNFSDEQQLLHQSSNSLKINSVNSEWCNIQSCIKY